MTKTAYIFPGQGSQMKGMGKDLFPLFPAQVEQANDILNYSIVELCTEDPNNQLSNTRYTQPALYVVNALTLMKQFQESDVKPDFFAGHSLGEYNALFAAGVFDFADGLQIVKKRGELMSQQSGGGMAAVIGGGSEEVRDVLAKNHLNSIDVANFNSSRQTVLSGPLKDLDDAKSYFEASNMNFVPLPVSAPFHSRYMADMRDEFESFLTNFQYRPTQTPVIANINALPYQDHQIIYGLKEQLCGSVQWVNTVSYLRSRNCSNFEEIGPGNVLTRLLN